jgi:hypothetical protein
MPTWKREHFVSNCFDAKQSISKILILVLLDLILRTSANDDHSVQISVQITVYNCHMPGAMPRDCTNSSHLLDTGICEWSSQPMKNGGYHKTFLVLKFQQ